MEKKLSYPVSIGFDFQPDGKMNCMMNTSSDNTFEEVYDCMVRARDELNRKIEGAMECPFSKTATGIPPGA